MFRRLVHGRVKARRHALALLPQNSAVKRSAWRYRGPDRQVRAPVHFSAGERGTLVEERAAR